MKKSSPRFGSIYSSPLSFLTSLVAVCVALGVASELRGATIDWDGGGDGSTFSQGTNWVGDVAPGVEDYARFFNVMTEPTVVFTGAAEVLGLYNSTSVGTGVSLVTLDINGFAVEATSTGQFAGSFGAEALWVNSSGGETGRAGELNITDSAGVKGALTVTNFTVGSTGAAGRKTAILRLQNGAILNALGGASAPTYIGRSGAGDMVIESGSRWNSADDITIGWSSDSAGSSVRVTGAGSLWQKTAGSVTLQYTPSHIYADNGGEIQLLQVSAGGINSSPGSSVEITGSGTKFSATVFNLSGFGTNQNGPAATFLVADSAEANVGQLNIFGPGTGGPGTVDLRNSVLTAGFESALASTFHVDSNLAIRLFDPTQSASLVALNALTITNSNLILSLDGGFSALDNDLIDLIRFDDSLIGQFAGLDEGDSFTVDGYEFSISYGVEKGGFVTLTVIPEPGMLALVVLAGSLVLLRRWAVKK